MTTGRIILLAAALCASGLAIGWLTFPSRPTTPPKNQDGQAEERHCFALTAADVKLDRERPSVAVSGDSVVLAWASQTSEQEYTLFLARSADRGKTFADPTPFRKFAAFQVKSRMRDHEMMRPSAVLPRLSAAGERIMLGWMEPGPAVEAPAERSMRFLVATSKDGGASFSEPVCISGEEARRPNFTALFAGEDGTTVGAWLDSQRPRVGLLTDLSASAVQATAYAGAAGKGVCPCCDVEAARTTAGDTLVAFRNSLEGNRDIYVTRSTGGLQFETPVSVSADHWRFDGCPHDGPSLALAGDRVHIAWMSAHTGKAQVYVADAGFADLTFAARPLAAASSGEQGHPRIAMADRTLHAVWDESLGSPAAASSKEHQHGMVLTGAGRAIMYTRSGDGGADFETPISLAPVAGAFQVRPVLAVDGSGGVHVAWNEWTQDGKKIVYLRHDPTSRPSTGDLADGQPR